MEHMNQLLEIMKSLRDPDSGCPWDIEQNFSTIAPYTIEEAYEVDEAIATGDLESLRDELGDLLFQVVFLARLAEERGAFDFGGVVDAIVDKLIRRHPHVFAEAETPATADGQRANWEDIKAAEREAAGNGSEGPPDPFMGIPRNLPALARSAKVAGRIERMSDAALRRAPADAVQIALDDLSRRETAVRNALDLSQVEGETRDERDPLKLRAERRALIGEGLAAWVRLARQLEIDPEQALRTLDDDAIKSIRANQHKATHTQVR